MFFARTFVWRERRLSCSPKWLSPASIFPMVMHSDGQLSSLINRSQWHFGWWQTRKPIGRYPIALMFHYQVYQDAFAGFAGHSLIFYVILWGGQTVGSCIFCLFFLLHKTNVCPCVRHLYAIFTFCICSSTNCRDTRWLWGNQWVPKSDWCSWWLPHSHTNPIVTSRCLSQSAQISFHNFTGILFFKFLPTRVSFEFGDVSLQLWYRTFIVIGFPHGGNKYVHIICKLILYLPCNTYKFLHVRCFQNIFNQGHFDVNTLFNFFLHFPK